MAPSLKAYFVSESNRTALLVATGEIGNDSVAGKSCKIVVGVVGIYFIYYFLFLFYKPPSNGYRTDAGQW